MPKQRAIFNPLKIDELEGMVRLSQKIDHKVNLVDISIDQLPDVIRSLQAISAEHQANYARKKIGELRAELTGSKPASVRPIGGSGPEAA